MMDESDDRRPDSLLPYDEWTEAALRQVMVRALAHAGAHGLPGGHHFYVTFRTDHPGTVIPKRLLAQFPHEMTIVLQHQFWDLNVDAAAAAFSVGLSFGGVPTTLHVPLGAVTAFVDPQVRFGLQFRPEPAAATAASVAPDPEPAPAAAPVAAGVKPQVVNLDAFRRRPPPAK